ncbi:MAG TPA: Hsp20/alpha crystallin family protein [Clostridiales bacterium]|nr:Hsp20/alpha crystallin family protein [Clostridiales bacterium]
MFGNLVPFNRRGREIENFFDRMFDSDFPFSFLNPSDMKVDIKENEKEYILEAEIPGVNKEQIHVDYQQNYLTIAVENREEINEERKNYIRRERKIGRSSRSFYVEGIEEDNISAKYENGILTVLLPKSKDAKPHKRIEIQ